LNDLLQPGHWTVKTAAGGVVRIRFEQVGHAKVIALHMAREALSPSQCQFGARVR
jgi:hypothetical protein